MILSQAFKIDNIPGGCKGERIIDRSVVSSLGMSANPVTMKAFREAFSVSVDPVDDPHPSASP